MSILDHLGLHWLDDLPVVAFAVAPHSGQTPTYSLRLLRNFGEDSNYTNDFQTLSRPTHVIIGAEDELLRANEFGPLLRSLRPQAEVTVLPKLGHMAMITSPVAFAAIRNALIP